MVHRQRIPLPAAEILRSGHAGDPPRDWPEHYAQWVVYTIWDSHRRMRVPLYVGVTHNCRERLKQHRKAVWWPLAGDITIHGPYATQADGLEAEEQQIHALQPLVNIVANVHTPPRES